MNIRSFEHVSVSSDNKMNFNDIETLEAVLASNPNSNKNTQRIGLAIPVQIHGGSTVIGDSSYGADHWGINESLYDQS